MFIFKPYRKPEGLNMASMSLSRLCRVAASAAFFTAAASGMSFAGTNPLEDFKLLYGSGTLRLDDATNKTYWTHCLQYTIRNGIIYDTAQLLADVEQMVAEARTGDSTP